MKILIIRPAALGDTLMLMPAVAELRSSASVILVGRTPGIDFLRPYVYLCLDFEGPGWHSLFMEKPEPGHLPPLPSVDRAVVFLADHEGRVKDNLRSCLPGASISLFPGLPPGGENIHVALYLARCLEQAGCPLEAHRSFEDALRHPLFQDQAMAEPDGRIVFHPGSGGHGKNHPPAFWFELMGALRDVRPFGMKDILVLLGPAEERLYTLFRKNLNEEGGDIVLSPGMPELVSILRRASLYVGHDSGVTHLAAMCGVPTIALFRDSPVEQWRPLGPMVKVIRNLDSSADLIAGILEEAMNLVRQRQ